MDSLKESFYDYFIDYEIYDSNEETIYDNYIINKIVKHITYLIFYLTKPVIYENMNIESVVFKYSDDKLYGLYFDIRTHKNEILTIFKSSSNDFDNCLCVLENVREQENIKFLILQ